MDEQADLKSFADEDEEIALVVAGDPAIRDTVVSGTEACGFQVVHTDTPDEAVKKLKLNNYNLIILTEEDPDKEPLEKNPIFLFIRALPMDLRRQTFVILLSGQYKSHDGLQAFLKSVDMVINTGNIKVFRNLLKRGLFEHKRFYAEFMTTLRERIG